MAPTALGMAVGTVGLKVYADNRAVSCDFQGGEGSCFLFSGWQGFHDLLGQIVKARGNRLLPFRQVCEFKAF